MSTFCQEVLFHQGNLRVHTSTDSMAKSSVFTRPPPSPFTYLKKWSVGKNSGRINTLLNRQLFWGPFNWLKKLDKPWENGTNMKRNYFEKENQWIEWVFLLISPQKILQKNNLKHEIIAHHEIIFNLNIFIREVISVHVTHTIPGIITVALNLYCKTCSTEFL